MKTTSLEKIAIPSEAKQQISFRKTSIDLSDGGLETKHLATWLTGNWIGAGSSVGLGMIPFVTENLASLPFTVGFLTSISTVVFAIGSFFISRESYTNMEDNMRNLKKDISPDEWKGEEAKSGFRIYAKSRSNATIEFILPRRIFRRTLMNETVWYSPLRDVYTMQKSYLTRSGWDVEIEEVAGRRYVFQQALKSL